MSAEIDNPATPSPRRSFLRNTTPTPHLDKTDPLINGLGLDFLSANSYMNLGSIPNPDPGFGYGKHTTPAVAYRQYQKTGSKADAGKVVLPVKEEYYIHPIFSRDRWEIHELASRFMPHWDTLKPVWQLATLLLEEKVMSGFLLGMLDMTGHRDIKMKHKGDDLYSFEAKQNPTQQELWELWETIWKLKDVITFAAFENSDDNNRETWGETKKQRSKPGLLDTCSGSGSKIFINEDLLSILCSTPRVKEYSLFDGTDEASCLLRLRYMLATTLVHELVHALWIAHFAQDFEPFYRDYRHAELGWTYECLINGGQMSAICDRVTSPYGLAIQDWPGTLRASVDYLDRTDPATLKSGPTTLYPVPMWWLPKPFTHQFWDNVERFGLPALNCPRAIHSVII
ncbi:hypothetical protein E4T44_02059 [Aureobasidium sp. EXF-8845]|nr:hypothetical protein E4T44_02059 [Aureobasidium sp. EXF-8845]KAI4856458.1 hypothetical protein E4T45_02079 [Aureobasidium sp. EXF-8846]